MLDTNLFNNLFVPQDYGRVCIHIPLFIAPFKPNCYLQLLNPAKTDVLLITYYQPD